MVARVDAWAGDHRAALERVKNVSRADPSSVDALLLWADIAFWSGERRESEEVITRLERAGHAAEAEPRKDRWAVRHARPRPRCCARRGG